jgi:hypothetical protein
MTHHNAARRPARPLLVAAALAAALALIALALPHPAVGGPDRPTVRPTLAPDSKVGQVKRTRAYIALSFDGRRLRAYVCNGKGRRRATISTWFSGRWDGHSPITLAADGLELRIDEVHPDGHVTGRLRLRRGTRRFAVEPATGPAGLYDGTVRRGRHMLRATWIVLANRSARGAMACRLPTKLRCYYTTVTLVDGTTVTIKVCKDPVC